MSIRTIYCIALTAGICCHLPRAAASSFIYNLSSVLKGGSPASPSTPWLTAQFTDVAPGMVEMTLTASHLTGRESLKDFFLNLNPALNPCLLIFNRINSAGSFKEPRISVRPDSLRADGAGNFDIRFQFTGSGSGRSFGAGEQITYLISGIPGLNVSSFDFTTAPGHEKDGFFAAAQVKGIESCNRTSWIYPASGLVPVPEPQPAILLGSALAVWGVFFARRRSRSSRVPSQGTNNSAVPDRR